MHPTTEGRWWVQYAPHETQAAAAPLSHPVLNLARLGTTDIAELAQRCPNCHTTAGARTADRYKRWGAVYQILTWSCGHQTGCMLRDEAWSTGDHQAPDRPVWDPFAQ